MARDISPSVFCIHSQGAQQAHKVIMGNTTYSYCHLVIMCSVLLLLAVSLHAAPVHSKVAVTLNEDAAPLSTDAVAESAVERTRRSTDDDVEELLRAATSPRHQRSRRSAAWWLHATIQLCNSHSHLCKSIEVMEGNVKVQIRLEAE